MMRRKATAMIREFWPVIRALRREGMSWRRLPKHMRECYGVPVVSHVTYILIAHTQGDLAHKPRPPVDKE